VTHPETLNKTAGFSAKTMLQNLILPQAVDFSPVFPRRLASSGSAQETDSIPLTEYWLVAAGVA
jgi:hypothetical protein